MRLSSVGLAGSSYRSAMARTSAAKPAALEARPAAVGKLLTLTMRRGNVERAGSEGSADSRARRRARRELKQACVRALEMSCGDELSRSVSVEKEDEHEAVVCVRRSAWFRVTEMDEFVGRLSLESRLPQYLGCVSYLDGGAVSLGEWAYLLDDGDVHRRCGAGAIDVCMRV